MANKKREVHTPEFTHIRLARNRNNEIYAIADEMLGASHIKVLCADGKLRIGRILGKLKGKVWIRTGDVVIIRPWSFQDDKADVIWRYTKTESSYLIRIHKLPKEIADLL